MSELPQYTLSATFDHEGHRANPPTGLPKYTSIKAGPRRNTRCDECFVLQHESPRVGQRIRNASWARDIYGNTLYLCTPHAFLWKERDAKDESDTRGPRVL